MNEVLDNCVWGLLVFIDGLDDRIADISFFLGVKFEGLAVVLICVMLVNGLPYIVGRVLNVVYMW